MVGWAAGDLPFGVAPCDMMMALINPSVLSVISPSSNDLGQIAFALSMHD
jgi:hypothetical protein